MLIKHKANVALQNNKGQTAEELAMTESPHLALLFSKSKGKKSSKKDKKDKPSRIEKLKKRL